MPEKVRKGRNNMKKIIAAALALILALGLCACGETP